MLNFKSTATELEAIGDLNLDGDGTSDEYDFMDDVAGGKEARQSNGFKEARRKYVDMLQDVADRKQSQVTVELDDLDNVSHLRLRATSTNDLRNSTKRRWDKISISDWWSQLRRMQIIT